MKDTALYEHLVELRTPWSVKKVGLYLSGQRVVVAVVLNKGQVGGYTTDATKGAHINGWTERQWRHLDICQFEILIKARVPQLKCSRGTFEELVAPWAGRYSRVTTMMTGFVIMFSAVERGMLRRTEEEIPYLGIDERSSQKGCSYATFLTGIDRSRVLGLTPEIKLEATKTPIEALAPTGRATAKAAKRFFEVWSTSAMRSRLKSVKKAVKTLRRHEKGLLNFSQHKISNACAERVNSTIEHLMANARGFRNFTSYRARILCHCGKLDLSWV